MRFAQRARLSIRFSAKPPLCRQRAPEGPEWLAMRHSGTTAFSLKWAYDVMPSKEAGEGGEITTALPSPGAPLSACAYCSPST